MSSSAQESSRAARLDVVLGKALDVSGSALGDKELSECFGSIKTQFGPAMSRLFQNMLVKLRSQMEASYKDICIRRDLEDRLLALETAKFSDLRGMHMSTEESINDSVEQLKRMEMEHIKQAMKLVEAESLQLQGKAARLRAAIFQEVDTLTQESQKMHRL
jgi:hypothetical protein